MADERYWRIDYHLLLETDAHVGNGTMLFGGNMHAVCRDERNLPFIPDTEVRGLLRSAGYHLDRPPLPQGRQYLLSNLGDKHNAGKWSFTRCGAPSEEVNASWKGQRLFPPQAHIKVREDDDAAPRLFGYEKIGGETDQYRRLEGSVFSHKPASEEDVAFLIVCMRFDNRVGRRRTRGYGKVRWIVDSIQSYRPGGDLIAEGCCLDKWIDILLPAAEGVLE